MNKKLIVVILAIVSIAVFSLRFDVGTISPTAAAPPDDNCDTWLVPTSNIYAKIEPALLKELQQACITDPRTVFNEEFRFIIHLWEEADLSTAERNTDLLARRHAVIDALQQNAARSQSSLRAYLQDQQEMGAVISYRPFWVVNAIAVTARSSALLELTRRVDVKLIRADHVRQLEEPISEGAEISQRAATTATEWHIERTRVPLVWETLNITGTGMVVANMDTGVDWYHPALLENYRGYRDKELPVHAGNWYCATDEEYLYPGDGNGHGTHTIGTMVGADGIGVAPGAEWIAVKIFNNGGYSYDSWIHAGFEWILAPDGDPALAPDVVNNSWGSNIGADETFRPDVQAWNAAGIVSIFSSGNQGPRMSSVGAPGSFDEVLAVGATSQEDEVTNFSSRGPSPWGEVKPEIAAPGAEILSTAPGGSYREMQGTSMAAPSVAGVAALMLQADPDLSIAQLYYAITSTAMPLGDEVPNNDTGWGLLDAYGAVGAVALSSEISGTVTRAVDGAPLSYATVEIVDRTGDWRREITCDATGHYSVFLSPNVYDLTADSFAYESTTLEDLHVVSRTPQTVNFALTALPTGILFGNVQKEDTDIPLSATLSVSGTHITATTDAATGLYSQHLPAGEYTLRVESWGHRVLITTGVRVTVGSATELNLDLAPAPTILLVDSGAWYYRSEIEYFQQALADLRYLYDTWKIKKTVESIFVAPDSEDLAAYDIIIWSSPEDSPHYTGSSDALTDYLDQGGKLFITGQDIGFWDQYRGFYRYRLRSIYKGDNAPSRTIIGEPDSTFASITLTLNGDDSADNQKYPDMFEPIDDTASAPVYAYEDGGYAGQEIGLCTPYRAVYFAFGFEGISGRDTRREVMERVIETLTTPPQPQGLRLEPARQVTVKGTAAIITHTLLARNEGQNTEQYSWKLTDADWQTEMMNANFTAPLAPTFTLDSCQWFTVGVRVTTSTAARFNLADQIQFTLQSQANPAISQTALITSKLPAPILLVDDDRWYEREGFYQNALDTLGLPYDYWNTDDYMNVPDSLPLSYLARYPIVIWFTAYDWHRPLLDEEEVVLKEYLDAGGRLFFTSQDYLYYHDLNDFGRDYLGIYGYTEDMTVTHVTALGDSAIGAGLGHYELEYPYRNWSDEITPTASATGVFADQRGEICAVANLTTATATEFRSVFFGFPFDALPKDAAPVIMSRVVEWLSPLGDSSLAVDKQWAAATDTLDYTIILRNTHPNLGVTASLSATLPAQTSYLSGEHYDALNERINWHGYLAPRDTVTLEYRVAIDPDIADMEIITNTVFISDDIGIHFTEIVTTAVNAPLFAESTKQGSAITAKPGDVVTYTITLRNTGTGDGAITLRDTIPTYTEFISDSLYASAGNAGIANGVITWTGEIIPGAVANITYAARISVPHYGFLIDNRAVVTDGFNAPLVLEAIVDVRARVYLPLIVKSRAP